MSAVSSGTQRGGLSLSGIGVIQINLNNSWTAQQLLLQTMAERGTVRIQPADG